MIRLMAALLVAGALVVAPLAVAPAAAAPGAVVTVRTFDNSEALGRTTLEFSWTGPSDPFSFAVDTSSGTAIEGTDFTGVHRTESYPAATGGSNGRGFLIPIADDALIEGPETFTITLSNITGGATFTQTVIVVTIADNDPTFAVNNVSVAEGNSGVSLATFTVTQSAPSTAATSVNYATAAGSASAGSDYISTSGTLTFAPGIVTQTVAVTVVGDLQDELDEQFALDLSVPVNGSIGDGQGIATITDDDIVGLSVSDVSVSEGDSTATFTVTLSMAAAATVSVDYATVDGTATTGLDYVATSGTLTFAPGELTQDVLVTLTDDAIDEVDEAFVLNLTAPAGAVVDNGQGTATLADDDPVPVLTIVSSSSSPIEGDVGSATTITLTITRIGASSRDISVDVAGVSGAATNGADFAASPAAVTIPAGPGPASVTYTVQILGDSLIEGAEEFAIVLSNPVNAALDARSAARITITDDDQPAAVLLAVTGSDPLPFGVLGGILALCGLALLAVSAGRRRDVLRA